MKIKYVCGLLALFVLSILVAPLPAPAQADPLEWVKIDKPGLTGNLVVSPAEVSEIAVGRRGSIYALDRENLRIYHSTDDGGTWDDITSSVASAGAAMPASKIAVAPDSAATVAVVTNAGTQVYLSTDSGITWISTSVPALAGPIQAVAISGSRRIGDESVREIAIGTAAWGNSTTTGEVWVLQLGRYAQPWRNQGLSVDPAQTGGEVSAIAYSPAYSRDSTMVVVAATGSDVAAAYQNKTWLCIGTRDTTAGTASWNTYSGYPAEIATAASPSAGDAPGVSRISASLALPSNYTVTDSQSRRLLVSYDRVPDASDDVYRLDDNAAYRLYAGGSGVINISSIAYYGTIASGKLLAGNANPVAGSMTVQVRRAANPFGSSPAWAVASQPPTGPGDARVGWSSEGDLAYCGTGQSPGVALDESAFSTSSDDGDNWQQLSLMDTQLRLSDIVPAPDSKSLFLATDSLFGPEGVWRTAATTAGLGRYWSRQLTLNSTSNRVILRLSPNYASDYTIYAAELGGSLIAVSHNRGNSWRFRNTPGPMVDLAIEDENTLYAALPGGLIKKSGNGAWYWGDAVATGLPDINMVAVVKKGHILVGGKSGEVAYSTDGGATFRQTPRAGSGDVHVVADTGYEKNAIIYAGSGNNIYRLAIGGSGGWEVIRTVGANQLFADMAVSDGVLYGAWYDTVAGNSGVARSLEPTAVITEWDTMDAGSGAARFDTAPRSLKMSSTATGVQLWAIDSAGAALLVYEDTLARTRLTPVVPARVLPDPVSGRNSQFIVTWPAAADATEYEVEVQANPECTLRLLAAPVQAPAIGYRPPDLTSPVWTVNAGLLDSGKDYFVRVRARNQLSGDQVRSLWSVPVRFTVAPGMPVRVPYGGPVLTAPGPDVAGVTVRPGFTWTTLAGVVDYEIVLAKDPGFGQVVTGTPARVSGTAWQLGAELDYDTSYFWRVRAVAPAPGEWSPVGSFTTLVKPLPSPLPSPSPSPAPSPSPSPLVVFTPTRTLPPAPSPSPVPPLPAPATPAYVWAAIIIGSALVITVVVLIIRMRR